MLQYLVLAYFAFHSYLLKVYQYQSLSNHTLFIICLQFYLSFYKQSKAYEPLRQIAQKQNKQKLNSEQFVKQCFICKRVKPSRYYHCRRCNICIYRMDHHCQWVNNCIGHFNSKPYLHFLTHLLVHTFIVFFYIFVWDFYAITANNDRKIYLLFLVIPVVFVLYETQRLLKDFYSMVKINQTLVESYKNVRGQNQSILINLEEFLGTKNKILWLIPFYLPFSATQTSPDLYEKTVKMEQNQQQPEDHSYADEYLYGKDEDGHQKCDHQHKTH